MKWSFALALLMVLPSPGHANCRHALALGLDVSGSVDALEYRLQLDGVATALRSDAVSEVLFRASSAPISIAVFEWSGPNDQTLILPWTSLVDKNARDRAVAVLRRFERSGGSRTTAIGSAMEYGERLLAAQNDCWRHTLDLSGDGDANTGPRPQDVRLGSVSPVVNGLVVGSGDVEDGDQRLADIKALSSYYDSYVIRGAGSFVETALGFENYAEAMERKLIRELQSIAIGALPRNN